MSSQKGCSGKKGSPDVTGKVVVVAAKASKEISRTALVWALTHVAQPGDCIKLLVVIPAICSNNRIWGLSKLVTDCITSRLENDSDQREISVNSCSQMVLQLHDFYDPQKIKIRVKILSGSSYGAVAAEARRVQSSWVILDKKLKNEKKSCMEELNCNIVIMGRFGPKVLQLNLINSPNIELKGNLNAFPRNFKDKSQHPDNTTCPVVSSPKQGSNCPSIHEEGESDSERENMSLSSKSSYFQPWISNAMFTSIEDTMLRSSDESLVSTPDALFQKFLKLDQDPILGMVNCKLDVNLSKSVREAISLAKNSPPDTPPPLCSICQHKAPVFGNPPRWFTFAELQLATGGFSQANFLAEGEFGSVHRGVLPDGQVIAVKQCKLASTEGDEGFCSEVEVLSCAQHCNVVMLIGFCVEGRRRLLVYEYICNGSLYSHLHGQKQNVLKWSARQKIAIGAARGLRYLHEECRVGCIVHRDMRPNNILLTHDFQALVGDFGLARWQQDGAMGVETRVVGTFGYLAPEYTQSGQITEKADVFSFGVVLLELVTGQKAVDMNKPKGQQCLHEWARPLLEGNAIHELVDPGIRNCGVDQEVHRMLQCSSLCIQQDPNLRPRMSQVLRMLESGK
ncbi:Tyrosine-protein kinase, active site [Sesbania bispinosa]|nr:Tyrosine-protein kinase, active site [Sesbania bispinosa]